MNTTILTKSPLFRTNKCLLTYFIIYLLSAAKFRPGKIPVMYTDLSDSNVESTMTFIKSWRRLRTIGAQSAGHARRLSILTR